MTSPGRRCPIAISNASRNEFGAQMTRHRPTNDLPAPGVQHDREIQEPGRRRHEGDVGDPEFIPTHGGEITIHQIRRRSRVLVTARRRHTFSAATGTRQPGATHQVRDPLAAVPASVARSSAWILGDPYVSREVA